MIRSVQTFPLHFDTNRVYALSCRSARSSQLSPMVPARYTRGGAVGGHGAAAGARVSALQLERRQATELEQVPLDEG